MFREFLILLIINFVGVIIQSLLHLPLPGTIIGMLILFFLLSSGILKLKTIERVCDFMILNMIIFFLPPAIELLDYMTLLKTGFFKILFLLIITTLLTMVVTGKTVDYCIKRMEKRK